MDTDIKIGVKNTTENKLTEAQWAAAERPLDVKEKAILDALFQVFEDITSNSSSSTPLKILGLYYKELVRNKLQQNNLISLIKKELEESKNLESKEKSKQKVKAKDLIIEKNSKSQIPEQVDALLRNKIETTGLNSQILELRGIALLVIMKRYIELKNTNYDKEIMDLQITVSKFIDTCRVYKGLSYINSSKLESVNEIYITDIIDKYNELNKKYLFNGLNVLMNAPELLQGISKYGVVSPSDKIKPRNHQELIIRKVYENMDNPFLFIYDAMINSGKSTAATVLGRIVDNYNKKNNTKLKLLLVCHNKSVQEDFMKYCNGTATKFAIAHKELCDLKKNEKWLARKKGTIVRINDKYIIKITNSRNCRGEDPVCIIASANVAGILLQKAKEKNTKQTTRTVIVTRTIKEPKTREKKYKKETKKKIEYPEGYVKDDWESDNETVIEEIIEIETYYVEKEIREVVEEIVPEKINDEYILFLDDATIGADQKDSQALRNNAMVMANLPLRSILASATFPDIKKLTSIKLQPNTKIEVISSNDIYIAIDVRTLDSGISIVPYSNCNTREELKNVVSVIESNPFLQRMLTHNIALELYNKTKEFNLNITDINTFFSIPTNLTTNKVKNYILDILKQCVDKLDDEKIKQLTHVKQSKKDSYIVENELGTTKAHRTPDATLIATLTPFDFTLTNFSVLIEDVKNEIKKNYSSFTKMLDQYYTDCEKVKELNQKIEDRKNKRKNKDQELEEEDEIEKPTINFPSFGQINTQSHSRYYKTSLKQYRTPVDISLLKLNLISAPEELMILLCCGVGIYSPTDKRLTPSYLSLVLKLADEKKLAYLIADNSISSGTNYPISCVIVMPDYEDQHGILSLFQLLGRAGRAGKSTKAEAFVPDMMNYKILKYAKDPSSFTDEIDNINNAIMDNIDIIDDDLDQNMDQNMDQELDKGQDQVQVQALNQGQEINWTLDNADNTDWN